MRRLGVLFVVILLVIGANALSAREAEGSLNRDRNPNALGFQTGSISGSGLSWQRWFGPTGLQIAGGILYRPPGQTGFGFRHILDYSVGVEVQRSVVASDFSERMAGQLYVVGGVNHGGIIEEVWEEDPESENRPERSTGPFIPSVSVGVGLGIEFVFFEHFSIPFEMLYAAVWRGVEGSFPDQLAVDLAPQIGIRYRF